MIYLDWCFWQPRHQLLKMKITVSKDWVLKAFKCS